MNPLTNLPQSVAIVSNSADRLYQFRAPIIRRLLESGIRVYAIAPPGRSISEIESLGAQFVAWRFDRRSVNPMSEIRSLACLVRIYRRLKPDVAQHFTVKPNVYGALAARLAGVPVVVSGVQGLGYAFGHRGRIRCLLRSVLSVLYKLTALLSDRVMLLNSNDLDRLFSETSRFKHKAMLVPGGVGVNLKEFSAKFSLKSR